MSADDRLIDERAPNPSRRLRRWALAASLFVLGGVVFEYGSFLWARASVPVTFSEADLDKDGTVSLSEALYISDSGARPRGTCTEYFAHKDGNTIKIVCP